MKIDLCALTVDLLPLYAEDLLSPETRQLLEAHAVECPACRERLRTATAPSEPPPWPEDAPDDKPVRRFVGRLRRLLYYGLVGVMILLVGAGSIGYVAGRKQPWERERIPARVAGADELAARAIPGWGRAEAQGLVVNLGVTEKIANTQASITLEKAWYSGRQAYILYTVKAPEGGYVLPTRVFAGLPDSKAPWTEGGTDWNHLSQWGGFSADGFHSVIIFQRFSVPDDVRQWKLTFYQFAPVTPETGLEQGKSSAGQASALVPWSTAYMQEPAPEIYPWPQQHTWMGRTLALKELQVGIGRTRLIGSIDLPQGERKPQLLALLQVGDQVIALKDFKAEPTATPGRYDFVATFDGANQWPAPVKLELNGIAFESDMVLEWPVNWAKYRDRDGSERRLMDPGDQVTVRFYDSELTSIYTARYGVSIEQKDPTGVPPYVRASLRIGSRVDTNPGMEVVNARGEVLTNFGGGGGVIYDDPKGHDQRQGIATMWGEEFPESFRQSDRLVIRYVHPEAVLILKETWEMR